MNRKRAITKMGWIMAIGLQVLIIALGMELIYFNSSHGFYAIFAAWAYIYMLGSYIKKMLKNINEKYPKEDNPL